MEIKKNIIILISFLIVSALNSTEINSQYVSGTWTLEGSPYNVNCDIEIPNNETLIIEPGVQVNFIGHYMLDVQGQILAEGDDDNLITFNAENEEIGWLGIRFIGTSSNNPFSMINFCQFENGNANIFNGSEKFIGGAIYLKNFSKVIISNNIFQNNRAGAGSAIGCNNSSPTIARNLIKNNQAGSEFTSGYAAIECRYGSTPIIIGNIIEENSVIGLSYAAGAGIRLVVNSDAIITGNIIRNNYIISDGNLSEGSGLYIHSSDPVLLNNVIYDNYITPVTNHGSGGAIFFYDSEAYLVNNTIKCNTAAEGGGLWFKLSDPNFFNNIIWYNETSGSTDEQIFFDDDESDPNFYYNNIQGGQENFGFKYDEYTFTGDYFFNIDEDPGYNGDRDYDYSLSESSPCINAGTLDLPADIEIPEFDIAGNPRIVDGSIDMGAYEYQITSNLENLFESKKVELSQNYPNPFNPTTTIQFSLASNQFVKIMVFNAKGEEVSTLVNKMKRAGNHRVEFNAAQLPSGQYFYQIQTKQITLTRKMLLIK